MTTLGTIAVSAEGASTHTGSAVTRFHLLSLRSALKLEKVGIKLSRGRSALKIAKVTTGLVTNDRDAHINKLNLMIADLEKNITLTVAK